MKIERNAWRFKYLRTVYICYVQRHRLSEFMDNWIHKLLNGRAYIQLRHDNLVPYINLMSVINKVFFWNNFLAQLISMKHRNISRQFLIHFRVMKFLHYQMFWQVAFNIVVYFFSYFSYQKNLTIQQIV